MDAPTDVQDVGGHGAEDADQCNRQPIAPRDVPALRDLDTEGNGPSPQQTKVNHCESASSSDGAPTNRSTLTD